MRCLVLFCCGLAVLAGASVAEAAFPGRNGRIVYSAGHSSIRAGLSEIYSVAPSGGSVWQLTRRPATFTGSHYVDQSPSWSPGGRQIVFSSNRDGDFDLYRMNADGSRQTRVATLPGSEAMPSWSRDGRTLLFVRRIPGEEDSIWRMDLDGTNLRRLLEPELLGEANPVWSPTADRVAFSWERDLWLANPDGSGRVNVTNTDFVEAGYQDIWLDEENPNWSPDGQRLVYSMGSAFGDYYGLWTIRADGKESRRLTDLSIPVTCCSHPAWSPDGTRVAFATGPGGPFYTDAIGITRVGIGDVRIVPGSIRENVRVFDLDWQPAPPGTLTKPCVEQRGTVQYANPRCKREIP
jgi:Tol biopolymer transport system component